MFKRYLDSVPYEVQQALDQFIEAIAIVQNMVIKYNVYQNTETKRYTIVIDKNVFEALTVGQMEKVLDTMAKVADDETVGYIEQNLQYLAFTYTEDKLSEKDVKVTLE